LIYIYDIIITLHVLFCDNNVLCLIIYLYIMINWNWFSVDTHYNDKNIMRILSYIWCIFVSYIYQINMVHILLININNTFNKIILWINIFVIDIKKQQQKLLFINNIFVKIRLLNFWKKIDTSRDLNESACHQKKVRNHCISGCLYCSVSNFIIK
jgi:hypothetical protein